MKITFLLAAVAALAATANAQTKPSQSIEDFLRNNPDFLKKTKTPGVRLFTTPGPSGFIGGSFTPKFTIEIVQQNSKAALRKLAEVLGANLVIDPAIQFLPAQTRTLYFFDVKEDAFADASDVICRDEPIERWKSSAGTYFFAAKPAATSLQIAPLFRLPLSENPTQPDETPAWQGDLFVYPFGGLPQLDLKGWGSKATPQPGWEKREFNGHEFYYIPAPRQ